jgi:alanine-alpha-ketoisovalerate/valine-pyruvate aminotransferase
MWSQIVTTSKPQRRRRSNLPWAFTEHGAVMAANVLRSPKAIQMSVYVVRAFIMQREVLATNATILKRLAEIDRTLLEHDSALQVLWKRLQPLLAPPPDKPKRKIGFHPGNR